MSAVILDGKKLSAQLREKLQEEASALRLSGVEPHLAVVLVGENPASQIYVRNKERGCEKIGIRSTVIRLSEACTQEELEATVQRLNLDSSVHGILVQLPLPAHLDEQAVLALIDPRKDVDGFHAYNAGRLLSGLDGFVPCTPLGALAMLDAYNIPIAGKHAVVVGRSNIVGKPMALLLLSRNATVTICHSRTQNLAQMTRDADILVCAVGKPNFITGDMIKPGCAVIDVGINRINDKVVGDVEFESASQVAGFITPVPGGVGQMTITMLLSNALRAARAQVEETNFRSK